MFICSKCDAQSPKWSGRCLECGAWGTLEEKIVNKSSEERGIIEAEPAKVIDLGKVKKQDLV